MLYVVGLGLSDEKDITVKGLEVSQGPLAILGRFGRSAKPRSGCAIPKSYARPCRRVELASTMSTDPLPLLHAYTDHTQAVKSCARIYLEYYTSILTVPTERLEAFYGKPIIPAYRETVELEADEILRDADKENVAFLVAGDPLR